MTWFHTSNCDAVQGNDVVRGFSLKAHKMSLKYMFVHVLVSVDTCTQNLLKRRPKGFAFISDILGVSFGN